MTTTTTPTTVYMGEGTRSAPDPSLLYRPLADLAKPGYYMASDLMHDAAHLAREVTGPVVIYWATRDGGGTSIGTEPGYVAWPGDGGTLYRITVDRPDRGHWEATIEEVAR